MAGEIMGDGCCGANSYPFLYAPYPPPPFDLRTAKFSPLTARRRTADGRLGRIRPSGAFRASSGSAEDFMLHPGCSGNSRCRQPRRAEKGRGALELTAAEPELAAVVTVIERMLSEDRGWGADAFLTLFLQWLI